METFDELGQLVVTLAPSDMGQLDVQRISRVAEWGCIVAPVAECAMKRLVSLYTQKNQIGIEHWTSDMFVEYQTFIHGLDPETISSISNDAFAKAVEVFSRQTNWQSSQLNALADKAIGNPIDFTDVFQTLFMLYFDLKEIYDWINFSIIQRFNSKFSKQNIRCFPKC